MEVMTNLPALWKEVPNLLNYYAYKIFLYLKGIHLELVVDQQVLSQPFGR
jgi:hypothetical protein